MANTNTRYFYGDIKLATPHYQSVRAIPAYLLPLSDRQIKQARVLGQVLPMGRMPDGTLVIADRVIHYKNRPSLHKCDARCMNARGHNCECSCGGKNHGINS